ncbi:LEAF RUST 10 DISEASE-RESISTANCEUS RECEPTOR-LIKE PROTEIN KINASE-like 1.4 isoform X2 [Coffea arabica]|uniref:non-specific serine/threonine protein kinase n=1 Tax=Coffea arabica TaxID=13443 RepID=A0A6P6TEG7_COFAR
MKSHSPLQSFPTLLCFLASSILLQLHPVSSNPAEFYETCRNEFSCGSITGIGYPFRGHQDPAYCGYPGLELRCDQSSNVTRLDIKNMTFWVLDVHPTAQTLRVAREDVMQNNCPTDLVNMTLDYTLFDYSTSYINVTFIYGCLVNAPNVVFSCGNNSLSVLPGEVGAGLCKASVVYPALQTGDRGSFNFTGLDQVLRQGFDIRWIVDTGICNECTKSGGRCGYGGGTNQNQNQTTCFCPNPPYVQSGSCSSNSSPPPSPSPSRGGKSGPGTPVVLAIVGAVLAGVGLGWLIFWCRQRRRRLAAAKAAESYQIQSKDNSTTAASKAPTSVPSTAFTKSIPSYPSSKTEFGKESSYFGVQVFSYSELEEATDGFSQSRELGDGGFGAVYYGVLTDGRVVAVKRLYENNFKRVEQFINEVEILTRLRHPNLVTLFGCTSKRSRELLLVYEYIPNGTVADHLHGKRASSGLLSWPVRLNIAIETADALAYLHKSDIIHRDVKTNNILLDNDFHVKVADFGLSRLFPNDVTHVSTAPQGTPGYVDPEYYQCYQLTEKSDVYSFGVVLIELISSLQAVDTNRHRHDINLANMAVNKIQNHTLHELVDSSLEFGTNSPMRRMTTLVAELAFRCLQQERDMRPSMQEVVDALRGIQNEGLNTAKVEVVHILVDDVAPLKHNALPTSPDSVVPDKWLSSSTPNSSG